MAAKKKTSQELAAEKILKEQKDAMLKGMGIESSLVGEAEYVGEVQAQASQAALVPVADPGIPILPVSPPSQGTQMIAISKDSIIKARAIIQNLAPYIAIEILSDAAAIESTINFAVGQAIVVGETSAKIAQQLGLAPQANG
jgi:hypothetical protein